MVITKKYISKALRRRMLAAQQDAPAPTLPAHIDTPDGGRVVLVSTWGDDLDVVNVARVSYDKHDPALISKIAEGMTARQVSLLNFLWANKHTSPFRHQYLKFQITAPIFVIRQWMKHTVGCAWNEASGRYIKFSDTFYSPPFWRAAVENTKQGSGGPIDKADGLEEISYTYERACAQSYEAYKNLLGWGVCHEQARTVLPLATMTRCVWTCSLQAFLNFLELRLSPHAQVEIQEYAKSCLDLVLQHSDFSETMRAALCDPSEADDTAD